MGKVGETRFKDRCPPQSDLAVALFSLKTTWLFVGASLIMSKRYVESEIALKKRKYVQKENMTKYNTENMSNKKI